MNTRKAKIRKGRFILAMMIFTISIFGKYDDSVNAEALPDFPPGVDLVSAADCIMSYMTSAGTFIANRDWIDELYTSFGGGAGFYINDLYQNGLLTLDEAGHYISTGLESALESQSAWSSLHLDELFSVSAEEAAVGGGVAATGAGTIAGAIGGVATTGALPLAIGVTGAYWGGIAIGTLIAHATGLYGEQVSKGVPIDTIKDALDSIPVGGRGVQWVGNNNVARFLGMPSGVIVVEYPASNDNSQIEVVNMNSSAVTCIQTNLKTGAQSTFNIVGISPSNKFWYANGYNYGAGSIGQKVFASLSEFSDYMEQIRRGEVTKDDFPIYSPDVITPDGNAKATIGENGKISIPSMVPEVDPTGQSIVPGGASRDDWLRWANGVKGNNTNNDPDANADILQQILEAIRTNSPSPGGNPNHNPNPDPTPTPVPKPDYDPSQPEQPEYDPKETEGPSDVTNGSPWTTPDLLDKFPFCLPRDVLRCFEKLDGGSRIAPSISWHFTTPLGIPFNFDLDLDDYEGIASLLRTLELIAFIIGLAIATRNLIGR